MIKYINYKHYRLVNVIISINRLKCWSFILPKGQNIIFVRLSVTPFCVLNNLTSDGRVCVLEHVYTYTAKRLIITSINNQVPTTDRPCRSGDQFDVTCVPRAYSTLTSPKFSFTVYFGGTYHGSRQNFSRLNLLVVPYNINVAISITPRPESYGNLVTGSPTRRQLVKR